MSHHLNLIRLGPDCGINLQHVIKWGCTQSPADGQPVVGGLTVVMLPGDPIFLVGEEAEAFRRAVNEIAPTSTEPHAVAGRSIDPESGNPVPVPHWRTDDVEAAGAK
jgi:hypothetical protein